MSIMDRFPNKPGYFRINMIDDRGTISFLAPPHGPKMLVAIAGLELRTNRETLRAASAIDGSWIQQMQIQLDMFDEFNVDTVIEDWQEMIGKPDSAIHPAFRVIDSVTRLRSLQPASLGLIVFNLKKQRIIQVQNHWHDLQREGAGRYREDGRPQSRMYSYALPEHWSLLP